MSIKWEKATWSMTTRRLLLLLVMLMAVNTIVAQVYHNRHHPSHIDLSATQGVPFDSTNQQHQQQPPHLPYGTNRRERHIPLSETSTFFDSSTEPTMKTQVETMWTRLLRFIPDTQLNKIHETKCLLDSINHLEREGFLFMGSEISKWRKERALRELEYILSQQSTSPQSPEALSTATKTIATEQMLDELKLSDFFFRFKEGKIFPVSKAGIVTEGTNLQNVMNFHPSSTADTSPTTTTTDKTTTTGTTTATRNIAEWEAALQNRRNTSQDIVFVQAKFTDGIVTFINTKWMEALMIFIVLSITISNHLTLPNLSTGAWSSSQLKQLILRLSVILPAASRIIVMSPSWTNQKALVELLTFVTIVGLLQLYVQCAAPMPTDTKNEKQWTVWKRKSFTATLYYCCHIWTWISLLFHSYFLGAASVLVIATTMIMEDLGLVTDRDIISSRMKEVTRLEPQLFHVIYPSLSLMSQPDENMTDFVPRVLVSSLNLLVMYLSCVLVRKLFAVSYLLILERPFIFMCCVMYYGTALLASSKWYMSHRIFVNEQQGPMIVSVVDDIGDTGRDISSTGREAVPIVTRSSSSSSRSAPPLGDDSKKSGIPQLRITTTTTTTGSSSRPSAASAASSYEQSQVPISAEKNQKLRSAPTLVTTPLDPQMDKKLWNEVYMRTNLVAVGSSSFFLLVAYLLNVNFLYTLTGYFIIVLVHCKYVEAFWAERRGKNVVWVALGYGAILYGSYMMIRSLPSLYNPVQKLVDFGRLF